MHALRRCTSPFLPLLQRDSGTTMLATPPTVTTSSPNESGETIDSAGPPGPGAGAIGLSDPMYSATRRKMLDLVNRLHSTG